MARRVGGKNVGSGHRQGKPRCAAADAAEAAEAAAAAAAEAAAEAAAVTFPPHDTGNFVVFLFFFFSTNLWMYFFKNILCIFSFSALPLPVEAVDYFYSRFISPFFCGNRLKSLDY